MAKKKTAETANIKAGPVLRAGSGGEQSTPVITKSYSVRDDWKDKGVVNYVAFKSVDGEVQDLTVNGQPAGGGGGASLISVEIINNRIDNLSNGDYNVSSVLSDQSAGWELPTGTLIYPKENWDGPDIATGNSYTIQNIVMAGNGNAVIFFSSTTDTYSVTGSITRVNDFQHGALFIVTGPGTITLS